MQPAPAGIRSFFKPVSQEQAALDRDREFEASLIESNKRKADAAAAAAAQPPKRGRGRPRNSATLQPPVESSPAPAAAAAADGQAGSQSTPCESTPAAAGSSAAPKDAPDSRTDKGERHTDWFAIKGAWDTIVQVVKQRGDLSSAHRQLTQLPMFKHLKMSTLRSWFKQSGGSWVPTSDALEYAKRGSSHKGGRPKGGILEKAGNTATEVIVASIKGVRRSGEHA
jgi:hypothetical protein